MRCVVSLRMKIEFAAPAKKRKSGALHCCVVDCHNSFKNVKERGLDVRFYRFPGKAHEVDRKKKWIAAVRHVK